MPARTLSRSNVRTQRWIERSKSQKARTRLPQQSQALQLQTPPTPHTLPPRDVLEGAGGALHLEAVVPLVPAVSRGHAHAHLRRGRAVGGGCPLVSCRIATASRGKLCHFQLVTLLAQWQTILNHGGWGFVSAFDSTSNFTEQRLSAQGSFFKSTSTAQ